MHGAHDILHGTPRSNLKLLGAGAYEAPQGKDFPPHRHSSWELVYYRAGHIRCPVGDEVFDVRPGMLLLTPPGVVHAEEARTAYANYYLGVEVSGGMDGPRACFDDADRSVGGLCHALVREWQGTGTDRDEMIGLLLRQLELVLRRVRSERLVCPAERIVAEIEHLLEQRYTAPVRIADLAREVGVSPSALRGHFARLRGQSPLAHLHAVRLRHAVALIRTSSLTLERVADLCGYDSASHLSRHVKQATGRSPGNLRTTGTAGGSPGA